MSDPNSDLIHAPENLEEEKARLLSEIEEKFTLDLKEIPRWNFRKATEAWATLHSRPHEKANEMPQERLEQLASASNLALKLAVNKIKKVLDGLEGEELETMIGWLEQNILPKGQHARSIMVPIRINHGQQNASTPDFT